MNTHYNLNLQTSAVPVVVNANQYDKGIRQYTFTVYNGDELADLTDVTAVTFDATKPDGYGLTYSGTITDGDIVITTTEQLTAVAGDVRGTIRLWNADSDVIGSQRVTVKVERNGVDDDTIISDSDIPAIANAETYATTCQTLVNSIASESAQIQEIADNQCIIEDDTANNNIVITQYEQGGAVLGEKDITSEFSLGPKFTPYTYRQFFKVTINSDKIVKFRYYGNWAGADSGDEFRLASANPIYLNKNYNNTVGSVSGTFKNTTGHDLTDVGAVFAYNIQLQGKATGTFSSGASCAISLEWYAPNA